MIIERLVFQTFKACVQARFHVVKAALNRVGNTRQPVKAPNKVEDQLITGGVMSTCS